MENQTDSRKVNPNQEKKVEKITQGLVKTKKKGLVKKFTDVFLSDDVSSVKTYLFEDVIIPAVKDILLDTVKTLLGVDRSSKNRSSVSKVSYQRCYDDSRERKKSNSYKNRIVYDYDDILLDSRGEAEDVLSRMDDLIETYGLVSVADLYDLVGITGSYTDNRYGWTNIRSAKVIRERDGYLISLPKAQPLN